MNANTTVTADEAKQDRIQVVLGTWLIEGDDGPEENAAGDLLYALSHLRVVDTVQDDRFDGSLHWFNAYQRSHGSFRLNFRSRGFGGHQTEHTPLIAGYLNTRRIASRTGSIRNSYQLQAYLSLNPTRFVRHRGWGLMGNERQGDWYRTVDPSLLLSRQVPAQHQGEVILRRNDNVLLTRREQSAGRADVWWNQVSCYYRNVWSFLDRCIGEQARERQLRMTPAERHINLREVETYWEFETNDALHLVATLAPHLMTLSATSNMAAHSAEGISPQQELDHNSLSVSLRVPRGRTVKLYSKTNRRVRLEITHDLSSNADAIGGSHTSTEVAALFEWLGQISEDAAELANEVLDALRPNFGGVSEQLPAYVLFSQIYQAAPDQEVYDWLVSQLVNTGRITLERSSGELDSIVMNLARQGVLSRVRPYSRTFRLNSQFSRAWQMMQHNGILQGTNNDT
ncbi:MAG: hypothetical protein ABJM26_11170 [Anderseniella sp.]